jgi:hypothetical protein
MMPTAASTSANTEPSSGGSANSAPKAGLIRQTVVVDFSGDGYRPNDRQIFYLSLPTEYKRIVDVMAGLVNEKQHRVLHVRCHAIHAIVARDEDLRLFDGASDALKFEVIPEDQRQVKVTDLVKVVQAKVTRDQLFAARPFPFFLKIARRAVLENVRDQIKRAIGLSDDDMASIRFMIKKGKVDGTAFESGGILKKGAVVGGAIDANSYLVMILPAAALGRSRNDPLRILN